MSTETLRKILEPSCSCIEIVDAELAQYNTRLAKALVFRPSHTRLMIETEIVEKKRGARPLTMFPTFCPFCGVKCEGELAAPAKSEVAA